MICTGDQSGRDLTSKELTTYDYESHRLLAPLPAKNTWGMVSERWPHSTVIFLQARGTSVGPTTGIYTPIPVLASWWRQDKWTWSIRHGPLLHITHLSIDFFMQAIHYLDKSFFEFRPNSCMYDMRPLPGGQCGPISPCLVCLMKELDVKLGSLGKAGVTF